MRQLFGCGYNENLIISKKNTSFSKNTESWNPLKKKKIQNL